MASAQEAIKLLDGIIAKKRAYIEKSENKHVEKEVDALTLVSKTLADMAHLVDLTSHSYRLLLHQYEIDIKGKLNPDKAGSLEEYLDNLKRLTNT